MDPIRKSKEQLTQTGTAVAKPQRQPGVRSQRLFLGASGTIMGLYALLLLAMLVSMVLYTSPGALVRAFQSSEIRHAALLSLVTSTIAAIVSLWVAVPTGYLLARFSFPGKRLLDLLFDVPILLPPLVVGIGLLVMFRTIPGRWFEGNIALVTYEVPAIVLAQFTVACAFAVRTMRVTFEAIDPRTEDVARTLGCSRASAFFRVTLGEAKGGMLAAGTLAWARALGEFGPVLVFAGTTRMKTEVLPTSVYLEWTLGEIEAALAVSLLLVLIAVVVLGAARLLGVPRAGI